MLQPDKVNLITADAKFEGTVEFGEYTRFEGQLRGTLRGTPGSHLILGENGVVEGELHGDVVIIDGFVRGNIIARTKVVISGTGKVVGEIKSPSVAIEFGGYFDGKCAMSTILPPTGHHGILGIEGQS